MDRPVDLPCLLDAHNPLVLAVEQTLTRGHEWSRTAAALAERIAIRVAGAIVRDRLKPGDRLLETEVSAVLGVSRAPTREALRILERERLVDFQVRRGAVVAGPREADLHDIFAVRTELHAILFAELMTYRRAELAAVFAARLPALDKAARSDAEDYVVHSYLLNLAIIDLGRNRLVADLLTSVALRTLRYLRLGYIANPLAVARSARSWHAVECAVARADTAALLQAVQARMGDARRAAFAAARPLAAPTAQF